MATPPRSRVSFSPSNILFGRSPVRFETAASLSEALEDLSLTPVQPNAVSSRRVITPPRLARVDNSILRQQSRPDSPSKRTGSRKRQRMLHEKFVISMFKDPISAQELADAVKVDSRSHFGDLFDSPTRLRVRLFFFAWGCLPVALTLTQSVWIRTWTSRLTTNTRF
eukprot:c11058_g1_i2.p1 GENE.c11058_g1_i2~~c11058_g1_i2.p1  ORF type:complete len:167 (-),score=19.96 c11058_g1_i2:479-979(-)